MPALPDGTLTFVFTDIEGSTRLLAALEDGYQSVLERHQVLLRSAIANHDGYEVSTEGDSFFCVFQTAADALAAAIEMQHTMATEEWAEGHGVRIRIGMHTGVAALGGDNYVGLDVHRASRISASAHGGQVLVSAATRLLGETGLPSGVAFRDLGEIHLKDLDRSEHVYQLDIDGLEVTFPSLRRLDLGRTNLPVFGTGLVGRERERQAIQKLFDESRLVTITGVAGAGKSRLAVDVAAYASETFNDGIWFVDLAQAMSADLVPQVVTSTMGLQESPSSDAMDVLIDFLRDGQRLLILDNCEHVIDGAGDLSRRLIEADAGLTILATSRQVLGIAGEARYPCPPLEVPHGVVNSREDVADVDSVILFDVRAREIDSTFTLDNDNAPVIAEICRRLDGLPLAIELAAALVRILTTQEILDRLHRRFELLTGGPSTAPTHQQTLRAALNSTFELLDEYEQEFASRLGVFAGGFDAQAAESVASGGDIAREDVLEALGSLVDRSLITSVHTPGGHRLTILESVREFLLAELASRGQQTERQQVHADYFASLVKTASAGLRGPGQDRWVMRLEADIENVRAAIAFLSAHADDAALEIVDRMFLYWRRQGTWSDGLHWTRLALQSTEERDSSLRARMLATAGFFASDIGEGDESIEEMEKGLAMARRIADPHAEGYCSSFLGAELSRRDTDLDRGLQLLGEAQQAYEMLNESYGGAWVNRYLGLSHQERGDIRESIRLQTLSLEAFRDAGDTWNVRFSQTLLGEAMHTIADLSTARDIYDESLRGSSGAQYKVVTAHAHKGLGKVSLAEGRLDEATENLYEAQRQLREIGDVACVAETKSHLAMVNLARGNGAEADELLVSSLRTFREINDQGGVAWSLERLAIAAEERGSYERAARLLSAGSSIRERVGSRVPPVYQPEVEELESKIADRLGSERFAAEAELVAGLGLDEAVALGVG
jgi:predicted ATPase/class 3 adenylate cyclase